LHERLEVSRVLGLVRLNADDYLPAVAFSDRHDLVRALHRLHAKDRWPLRRPQLGHVILFAHARAGAAERSG
jgi:3,4-dihydroxy-2-butanone 4-phosphate synthase